MEKSLSALSSFSENTIAKNRIPDRCWLGRSTGAATPEEALHLNLSPGRQVHRFRRLRLADRSPMEIETSSISGFALPSVDAVEASLYSALALTGHRPVWALKRLRAESRRRVSRGDFQRRPRTRRIVDLLGSPPRRWKACGFHPVLLSRRRLRHRG
ncbi:UTRA domain-containing protein [uncultured Brevundimonas sp.]|uniref:UTRA domain-containing protein n=1 Tax=uncultured Brevundimonas sp. TaxID=213418 RepID=UPI00345B01F1